MSIMRGFTETADYSKYKYKCSEMEIAIARFFDVQRNLIVPNVSYGMFTHECDLIILSPGGIASEVEIKISAQDLKQDAKKYHKHKDKQIHRLWFAIPFYLESKIEYIPEYAGILIVRKDKYCGNYVETLRAPKLNKGPRWDDAKRLKLLRLSTMRIWHLKEKLYGLQGILDARSTAQPRIYR